MTDSTIHVGGGGSKHKLRRVLVAFGVVVLVAAVAAGAGVGVRWLQQQREYNHDAKPSEVAKETTSAQDQALRGNYDEAFKTIDDALKNPNLSEQAKHDLYMQLGVTYEGQAKYDDAMASYRKAESFVESLNAAQSIARMAEAKGDKQTAITYYKKAITLIPDDETTKDSLKKYFENAIIVLEGGQPNYE